MSVCSKIFVVTTFNHGVYLRLMTSSPLTQPRHHLPDAAGVVALGQATSAAHWWKVLGVALRRQLDVLAAESTKRLTAAKIVQRRLEREREKLLQAHCADAILLNIFEREQRHISRKLHGVERQMAGLDVEVTEQQALVG